MDDLDRWVTENPEWELGDGFHVETSVLVDLQMIASEMPDHIGDEDLIDLTDPYGVKLGSVYAGDLRSL